MGEFELIRRYFQRPPTRADVVVGSGDDCALLRVPPDQLLAVSTDTLVSGVHFFADVDPVALGHKALAVNLSDLAAMGAEPAWVSLALTLPAINEDWVAGFARGFLGLAERFGVELVGGDMTRGPLSMTISVKGLVPEGQALPRNGAQVGDILCVTGALGAAALAVRQRLGEMSNMPAYQTELQQRLEWPEPRVALGLALRGLASSCLDLSDGLASDLGHVLHASGVGACIELARLPLAKPLQTLPTSLAWSLALAGGDDYELCFTLPAKRADCLPELARQTGVPISQIGHIVPGSPQIDWQLNGLSQHLQLQGWDHFKESS